MNFFVKIPYWKLVVIRLIPGAVFFIIIVVGIYIAPKDPAAHIPFLILRALGVSTFFHSVIDCGWWWSVITSLYDKFPDLTGGKIHRIKWFIFLLFCTYMLVAVAVFSGLIFFVFAYPVTGIIILVSVSLLGAVCMFIVQSFLIETLKKISRNVYAETIDGFNFSIFNPVRTWCLQKMIYEIFKNGPASVK